MNHTTEPWAAFGRQVIETISADRKIIVQCKTEEDAARIVACVNAMQGIEDPEAFVQEAKSSLSPFRPETVEAVKEALQNAPSDKIVPLYEHLDIARRTIAINPDDLNHHADYGDPPIPPHVLHGVCDWMNTAREDLLRAQLEFAKNASMNVFGTALADSVPDPDNPGLHIVEVLVATPGLCPHCKAKLNAKTRPCVRTAERKRHDRRNKRSHKTTRGMGKVRQRPGMGCSPCIP